MSKIKIGPKGISVSNDVVILGSGNTRPIQDISQYDKILPNFKNARDIRDAKCIIACQSFVDALKKGDKRIKYTYKELLDNKTNIFQLYRENSDNKFSHFIYDDRLYRGINKIPLFKKYIAPYHKLRINRITTGLYTICTMLEYSNCENIYITGFDGWKQSWHNGHRIYKEWWTIHELSKEYPRLKILNGKYDNDIIPSKWNIYK